MTNPYIEKTTRAWAGAEASMDIAGLDELLAADFAAVGPVGFVLDKAAWLRRFDDSLVIETLTISELTYRTHGDHAVAIGAQE